MVDFNIQVSVGPHMSALVDDPGREGVFPFTSRNVPMFPATLADAAFFGSDSLLTITAQGDIGSGVFLTGRTTPDGWTMHADSPEWLYHNHPDAFRYSLIGALTAVDATLPAATDWFYVGRAVTLVGTTGEPMKKLWLACNRPPNNGIDPGNGLWSVTVDHASTSTSTLDCSNSTPTAACTALVSASTGESLRHLAALVRDSCDDSRRLRQTISDRAGAINALAAVLVGELAVIGAVCVATIPPSSFHFAVAANAANSIAAIGAGIAGGAALVAGVVISIATEVGFWMGLLGTAVLTALAAAAGIGVAAFGGNFWALLAWIVLIAITAVTLATIEALLALQLRDLQNLDADLRETTDLQHQWDNTRARVASLCCPAWVSSADLTRPTCA